MITISQTHSSVRGAILFDLDSGDCHALSEPRSKPITVISEMNRTESIIWKENKLGQEVWQVIDKAVGATEL
jgi:hypothetical protein